MIHPILGTQPAEVSGWLSWLTTRCRCWSCNHTRRVVRCLVTASRSNSLKALTRSTVQRAANRVRPNTGDNVLTRSAARHVADFAEGVLLRIRTCQLYLAYFTQLEMRRDPAHCSRKCRGYREPCSLPYVRERVNALARPVLPSFSSDFKAFVFKGIRRPCDRAESRCDFYGNWRIGAFASTFLSTVLWGGPLP